MAIVVESVSKNTVFSANTCTIDKPSGLAAGELMIAVINSIDSADSVTIATLSGWTSAVHAGGAGVSTVSISIQYKVADSSDVSASNFTFTATNHSYMTGGIMRVSGVAIGNEVANVGSHILSNTSSDSTPNFVVSVAPELANSLVIISMSGRNDGGVLANASNYNSTPAVTYTELFDVYADVSSLDPTSASAYGIYTGTDTFTAFSMSSSAVDDWIGVLAVFNPRIDGIGTATLLQAVPTFFAPTSGAGTSGTAGLLQATPTFPTPVSTVTAPKWTNTEKHASVNVTNQDKS